jgi:two-component system LytT family response regulator
MYTTFIIEDEYPARIRLRHLMSLNPSIKLIGEADTGRSAIEQVNKLRPDVLFLDIHIPDMTGFQVLGALDYHPMVIFTTAYAEYAVQAFEVLSVDYLVKPFEEERFHKAVAKISQFQHQEAAPDFAQLATLFYESQRKPKQSSLAVKSGNKIILLDFEDITFLKADDKYVSVNTENKTYLCEKTLSTLDNDLPEDFIRVHRSFIINKIWIAEIHRYFKGRLLIVLDDKERTSIITSDSYTAAVKSKLGI